MKYRKKPVVIDAELFSEDKLPLPFEREAVVMFTADLGWHLETLEGILHITDGDYIIRGVKGEYYPCKPDIFAATYELAAPVPQTED